MKSIDKNTIDVYSFVFYFFIGIGVGLKITYVHLDRQADQGLSFVSSFMFNNLETENGGT